MGTTPLLAGTNRHGDLTHLFTAAGVVSDTQLFDPFGDLLAETGTTGSSLGFQSDYTDPTSEHVWMGARWYDGGWAAFLSRDTVFGELATPMSLNRHTYGYANPLSFWDPDGRMGVRVEGGGGTFRDAEAIAGLEANIAEHEAAEEAARQKQLNSAQATASPASEEAIEAAVVGFLENHRFVPTSGGSLIAQKLDDSGAWVRDPETQFALAAAALNQVLADPSLGHLETSAYHAFWQACFQAGHTKQECGVPDSLGPMERFLIGATVGALTGGVVTAGIATAVVAAGGSTLVAGVVGGVVGGQASRAGVNAYNGNALADGLFNGRDMLIDGAVGAIFGFVGGRAATTTPIDEALPRVNVPRTQATVARAATEGGVGLDGVDVVILDPNNVNHVDAIAYLELEENPLAYTGGDAIYLHPDAFASEELLIRTLGHERMHVYQNATFLVSTDPTRRKLFEEAATAVEQSFLDFFRRGRN